MGELQKTYVIKIDTTDAKKAIDDLRLYIKGELGGLANLIDIKVEEVITTDKD